jgi:hypothetical protein
LSPRVRTVAESVNVLRIHFECGCEIRDGFVIALHFLSHDAAVIECFDEVGVLEQGILEIGQGAWKICQLDGGESAIVEKQDVARFQPQCFCEVRDCQLVGSHQMTGFAAIIECTRIFGEQLQAGGEVGFGGLVLVVRR